MSKKVFTMALCCLLIQAAICTQPASASSKEDKQVRFAERVKAEVAKFRVGRDARVSVRLHDKTRTAGYISEVNEDSFVVTNLKTGANTKVAYPAVTKIKGQHITAGLKIALEVIGVAVGVLVLWAVIAGSGDLGR